MITISSGQELLVLHEEEKCLQNESHNNGDDDHAEIQLKLIRYSIVLQIESVMKERRIHFTVRKYPGNSKKN